MHDPLHLDFLPLARRCSPSAVTSLALLRSVAEGRAARSLDLVPLVRCDAVLQLRVGAALQVSAGDGLAFDAALCGLTRRELRRLLVDVLGPAPAAASARAVDVRDELSVGLWAEQVTRACAVLEVGDPRLWATAAQLAVAQGEAAAVRCRDADADDLLGAPLPVRLLAAALSVPPQRRRRGEQLLGVASEYLQTLDERLPELVSETLRAAGLPSCWDGDAEGAARAELQRLHLALTCAGQWRGIVAEPPLASERPGPGNEGSQRAQQNIVMLRAAAPGRAFEVVLDQTTLGIALDHPRSRIAEALRDGSPRSVQRSESTAFVDHAIFDRLASDTLCIALAASAGEVSFAVAVPPQVAIDSADLPAFAAAVADEWSARESDAAAAGRLAVDARQVAQEHFERELRVLAHEVSNPLAIIGNYVHLLHELGPADAARDATYRDYLRAVSEELLRAATLLRDATLRGGLGCPPPSAQDGSTTADQLLRTLQGVFAPVARARGAVLELADQGTADTVIGDASAIRQVLVNLLRNALEAVPQGNGVVGLRALQGQYRDGRPHVVFEVRDNGPGVSADVLGALPQAKPSTSGGAGLGLAIAYRWAKERLGGGLDAEASPAGTVFRLWVPAAP